MWTPSARRHILHPRDPVRSMKPSKRKRAAKLRKRKHDHHHHQEQRNWAEIPTDALSVIFSKLGVFEVLVSVQAVCRPWRKLSLDTTQQFWRTIDVRLLTRYTFYRLHREKLTIAAVERSGGHIEDLHVMSVSDAFLNCMSNRTSKLRCCTLILCFPLTPQVLVDFLRECPLLEELRIYKCLLTPETYGEVGRACPQVKTLWVDGKFDSDSESDEDSEAEYSSLRKARTSLWNNTCKCNLCHLQPYASAEPVESDSESETELSLNDKVAMEIANTMPQLLKLQLYKNICLTKKGLHFILDKCLHLEFLDIRRSFDVRIDDALQAKLAKIKSVRLSRRSRISLAEESA